MPSSATPSLLRAALTFRNSGVEIVNVLHGLIGDETGAVIAAPTEADLNKVGDLLALAWKNTIAKRQSNQLQLEEIAVVQATAATPLGTVRVVTGGGVAAYGGDEGLQAGCVLQQWRTGIARRGSNGRTFWSGLAAGDAADGRTVDADAKALWLTNGTDFYNGMIALNATRAAWTDGQISTNGSTISKSDVAEYTFGVKVVHKAGALINTFSDVVGTQIADVVAIQRRRMN